MSINIREARSLIRKAKRRVPEHESVTHLNLVAMMDMMSILLVFMIMSAATQTSALTIKDVIIPNSSTSELMHEEAVMVTIARTAILVEGEPIVEVINGDVPPSEKANGKYGIEITKLKVHLEKHHTRIKKLSAGQGVENPGEITVIADKDTPYRLLASVMYSAGQAEFTTFRMIVLRTEKE